MNFYPNVYALEARPQESVKPDARFRFRPSNLRACTLNSTSPSRLKIQIKQSAELGLQVDYGTISDGVR